MINGYVMRTNSQVQETITKKITIKPKTIIKFKHGYVSSTEYRLKSE